MGVRRECDLFTFNFHVNAPPYLAEDLHQIRLGIRRLEEKVRIIMATEAEVLQMLVDADTATNDIANDLQELIDQLNAIPAVPDSIKDAASGLVTKLQGVASVHPPVTPEPPAP